MVNGMIVDGLGHVSLDSGATATQNVPPNPSQANIHQGEKWNDALRMTKVRIEVLSLF